jgi:hypothetical protein
LALAQVPPQVEFSHWPHWLLGGGCHGALILGCAGESPAREPVRSLISPALPSTSLWMGERGIALLFAGTMNRRSGWLGFLPEYGAATQHGPAGLFRCRSPPCS